jgi:hypothetical protein
MGGRAIVGIAWRWTARFAVKDHGTEVTLDEEVRFPAGLPIYPHMLESTHRHPAVDDCIHLMSFDDR